MFTYLLTNDIGKVRLLVPDNKAAAYCFEDAEITAFVTLEGDVRTAAALALETIASDTAMTLKVISINGLSTNGPAVATSLLARAAKLREQALIAGAGAGFDVAEQVFNDFGWLEKIESDAMRSI